MDIFDEDLLNFWRVLDLFFEFPAQKRCYYRLAQYFFPNLDNKNIYYLQNGDNTVQWRDLSLKY